MIKYLYIEGDCNDGDYVYQLKKISAETLQSFIPLIEAIKKCPKNQNWPEEEYDDVSIKDLYSQFSDRVIKDFSNFIPEGDAQSGQGIHTIESIQILDIIKITNLLGEGGI